MRVYVDVKQSPQVDRFFTKFKRDAKKRFRQEEIWMTSHAIEVL